MFVEPYPDSDLGDWSGYADPEAHYELLESVELAFVAALKELPATQRAVLVLFDVLAMPAAEVAETLDTSVASVNSALQRARQTMDRRLEPVNQQATRRALGDDGQQELLNALVSAWERSDIDGIVGLLAREARFTMPPLPAWCEGALPSGSSLSRACSRIHGSWCRWRRTASSRSPATWATWRATPSRSAASTC